MSTIPQIFHDIPHGLSPESTGGFSCTCGNTTSWIGIDDCGELDDPEYENEPVALRQHFTTQDDEPVSYGEVDGLEGDTGTIGDYTRIECAECGRVLWFDGTSPHALANLAIDTLSTTSGAPISPRDAGELVLSAAAAGATDVAWLIRLGLNKAGDLVFSPARLAVLMRNEHAEVRQELILQLPQLNRFLARDPEPNLSSDSQTGSEPAVRPARRERIR